MKFTALLGLSLLAPICFAQSATTTYNGTDVVTVVTDAAANTYTVTTPFSVSVGSPVLVFNPAPVIIPPPPPPSGAPAIPANAIAVDLINPVTAWKNTKDAGTPGTATFTNTYPVGNVFFDDAGKSINARAFWIAYQNAAGVRFSNSFAKDTVATHFVYDTTVLTPDASHLANLELDINQVKANGMTAILGTQCSSYSKTWEVTLINASTGKWHWVPSNISCNPLTWTPNVPHHVRIFGTIDATGVSTYQGVELDGTYAAFTNATGMTARALGWSVGSVLPNFQVGGLGASGSATIYADRLTIIRW